MKIQVLISGLVLAAGLLFVANKNETSLKGAVQDRLGFGIESSVEVYQNGVLVDKGETKDDGTFVLGDLQPGDYKVRIKAQGYEDKLQSVHLTEDQTDLGVIRLKDDHITLDAVVIYGKKSPKKNFAGFF